MILKCCSHNGGKFSVICRLLQRRFGRYECEVGGDCGVRSRGDWLVVQGCRCNNCEDKRYRYHMEYDEDDGNHFIITKLFVIELEVV